MIAPAFELEAEDVLRGTPDDVEISQARELARWLVRVAKRF